MLPDKKWNSIRFEPITAFVRDGDKQAFLKQRAYFIQITSALDCLALRFDVA